LPIPDVKIFKNLFPTLKVPIFAIITQIKTHTNMKPTNLFETVGTISKKELLASFDYETDNAMVLESLKPYPGYHGTTVPDSLNPNSLFFVTNKKYSGESIIRATMEVKKTFEPTFDAVPGQITVFNTLTPCIRIKNLMSIHNIEPLVKSYREAGIGFLKSKKILSFNGLIKIRKYFTLDIVDSGIYFDIEVPQMAYFEIPGLLSWNTFEEITYRLKPNVDYNNFDAALGVFFTPKGVVDVVRIFHETLQIKDIRYLREKYLEEISRLT